jgi:hypothetical protein
VYPHRIVVVIRHLLGIGPSRAHVAGLTVMMESLVSMDDGMRLMSVRFVCVQRRSDAGRDHPERSQGHDNAAPRQLHRSDYGWVLYGPSSRYTNEMKRAITAVVIVGLTLTVALRAHDSFRIVGTITKLADTELSVKTKESKTFVIAVKKYTDVWRDKKKVDARELKVGVSVVVDALGDTENDLEAQDITIVPEIKSSR